MQTIANTTEFSAALSACADHAAQLELLGHSIDGAPFSYVIADDYGSDYAGALGDGTIVAFGADIDASSREIIAIAQDGTRRVL